MSDEEMSLLLALTSGDVSKFYEGAHPEIKQLSVIFFLLSAIGAAPGILTYAICNMVTQPNPGGGQEFPDPPNPFRLSDSFSRIWPALVDGPRDRSRTAWTEEEVDAEFDQESVRWHSFQRTDEGGYIVTTSGGNVIHPYKPLTGFRISMLLAMLIPIALLMLVPLGIFVCGSAIRMVCIAVWHRLDGSNNPDEEWWRPGT